MTIQRRESPHGFVSFVWDGKEYQLPLSTYSQGVSASYVGAFPAKQVIGDFTRVSHEVLSSLVQSDWTGGGQIYDSQEATDTTRYADIATLETRYPKFVTLLPETYVLRGPNDDKVMVLGDFPNGADKWFLVSFGSKMKRVDLNDGLVADEWTIKNVGDTAFTPTSNGVSFGNPGSVKFYIPGGAAGYCTFNGTATTGVAGTPAIYPTNFVVHDMKLWALDVNGTLYKSLDGATWTEVVKVPPGYTPRSVTVFVDRMENTTPHIVTDSMVFAVDPSVPAIYETELNYAPHPAAGLAAERWRGDLYVSIGMGLQRYTLGTVNSTGLDRDDGPGRALTGEIRGLARGFNDLFTIVSGSLTAAELEQETVDDADEVYVSERNSTGAVMRMTGMGAWHTVWVSDQSGSAEKTGNIIVSAAGGGYRLYWGWNGDLYYQNLPVNFENPRINESATFAETGELVSSWFDMGMTGTRMTLAAIEVRVSRASETEPITLSYMADGPATDNQSWQTLGTITDKGFYQFRVGANGEFPRGSGVRYDGHGFSRMRYRIQMARNPADATASPVLESVAVVYIKRMGTLRSFRFRVDCSSPELDTGWGLGNRARRELLEDMLESETFIPFAYNDRWYSVKIAGVSGQDATGMDLRGDRDVTVIESFDL